MALDLGGTNFRVLALELTADKEFLMDSKIYAIPQDIMTGMHQRWPKKIFSKMIIKTRLSIYLYIDFDF